ncbi:MAG: NUDIX hydrolase [Cyclobacteriaceae bacterium]|nr:NUDIX hydrolase [Cyclobacteriaceae bacterium]
MTKEFSWLEIAKRLEAIAQTGLTFTQNDYDRERYEEIREISHTIFHQHTETPVEKIYDLFAREKGYPTPKVDVRGVVMRDDKILLVREKLDNRWALPGGWADIGLTPFEVVAKEVREESGLEVKPVRLLAVLDKKLHNHPPSPLHVYKMFILCQENGGVLAAGMETIEAGFFSLDQLPSLSTERNTTSQLSMVYDLYKHPERMPVID